MSYLYPLKPDISLVVAPLFVSQDVANAHQHKYPAVVRIVLLGEILSDNQFVLFFVEHFSEF